MRRRAQLLLIAVTMVTLLAIPAAASAHVEIVSSSPEAGDNLDTAPTEVVVTFNEELDPDLSTFTVTDADDNEVGSGEVDLTVADRNVLLGEVSISDPGVYTVSYSVAGVDGHPIEGTFSFGFNTEDAIPEPTGGEEEEGPDTALPFQPGSPLPLVGVVLIGLAAVLGLRRLALR
ncbi:MAG TPA: copper resistance CopC family protein [Candidatus Limnocylindria bacterium]|jgi:methionine-rich copper-binding protein CopC